MPRNYQTGRSLDMFEESIRKSCYKTPTKNTAEIKLLKPLLLISQSLSNHMNALFGINAIKPALHHSTFSEDDEIAYDRLLLDSAKELMTRKSQEGKLSIHQMMQKITKNQLSGRSFNYLLEEISSGIKQLESYSELDDDAYYEDSLVYILEKDLHCTEPMLNVIWDNGWTDWICVEEADKVVNEVSERIFFRLLLELVKDLI